MNPLISAKLDVKPEDSTIFHVLHRYGFYSAWLEKDQIALDVRYVELEPFDPFKEVNLIDLKINQTKQVICKCPYQALQPETKSIVVKAFQCGKLTIEQFAQE